MAMNNTPGPFVTHGHTSTVESPQAMSPAGPDVVYQGDAWFNPNFPYRQGAGNPAIAGLLVGGAMPLIDAVPAALATNNIAATQTSTGGALTLSAGTGITSVTSITKADNTTFVPTGGTAYAIDGPWSPIVLGRGMFPVAALGATLTATTTQLQVALGSFSAKEPFFLQVDSEVMQVTGAATTSQLTVARGYQSVAAAHTVGVNVYGIMGANPGGTAATDPGIICYNDPSKALARNARWVCGGTATQLQMNLVGYDLVGRAQTEALAGATGGTVVSGTKAWKYLVSATPSAPSSTSQLATLCSTASTMQIGTGDVYGLPVQIGRREYLTVNFGGIVATASSGFTAPVTVSPATATTGHPTGTYALSTASNATLRLVIFGTPGVYERLMASPTFPYPLMGVPPV